MILKFLTVADGNIEIASRSNLETFFVFLIRDGEPFITIAVLLKFKLGKFDCSQTFNSLTHEGNEAVKWIESAWQAVYI